ncbi:MAG: dihydrodipicolinate synthase family protein [Clostridia bacterium]|nr:dihydrodipicolinate synthase family protein [Clostridia bacterium]
MKQIANGIYPVMITPFTRDNHLDLEAVDRMVAFYAQAGCHGLFAVCQSSEMFFLSEDERVALAKRVADAANGRMSVVASGHISDGIEDQIRELGRIAATGVDGVVMVSNRLAAENESDDVFIANMNRILDALPDVTFGMYECPYPYKRLLSERVLEVMAQSGRFAFIKDTCCDADLIARRIRQLDGRIKLFNANCATLLDTLHSGAAGFSGIMANFHPDLFVWLYEQYQALPDKAARLMSALSVLSGTERACYPVCCKYHMGLVNVPMETVTRCRDEISFDELGRREMHDLVSVEQMLRRWIAG